MSTSLLETRLCPEIEIERDRLLPASGRVTVDQGTSVKATDIVAEAAATGHLQIVPGADLLGVSRQSLAQFMCVREGDTVTKGTPLARKGWRFAPKQVLAPADCTVQAIADGQILLKASQPPWKLSAQLPGEIIHIYPQRGVRIRSYGLLVRGVWGSGGETTGVLATVSPHAHTLTWDQVSLRYRGTILVAGHIEDERVLYRAKQFRLRGIVSGGLASEIRPIAQRLAFPLLITEGLGRFCMAQPIYDLLNTLRGQVAILSTMQRGQVTELFLPSPPPTHGTAEVLPMVRPVQTGAMVRLTRPPYLGLIATVEMLAPNLQETAIGAHTRGAQVRLQNGRRVFVPYVNMELLDGLREHLPPSREALLQTVAR